MKKIIAWTLLVVMLLGLFAGCKKTPVDPTDPTEATQATKPNVDIIEDGEAAIDDVIEYLKIIYKDDGAKTPVDFQRFGVVRIAGIPFEVIWTADVGEDLVKAVVNEDGTVTIDVNEKAQEDTPYVLTATVADKDGNTASHSWNYILPKEVDMISIVKTAYELANGESLPYESTLTGKVVAIGTPYDPNYKNISCTIEVEGAENMPIVCYRLKGEGADVLAMGDTITVTGTLTNYNGTIEFAAGCILDALIPGERVEAPSDPKQIVDEAYALGANESLPYEVTLTGVITKIKDAYSSQYNNISVEIAIAGRESKPILCYRMKGAGIDDLDVGDTVTVKGYIINYVGSAGYSTIEFTAGCQMLSYENTGKDFNMPTTAAGILQLAYSLAVGESLPEEATLTGVITTVNTEYSSQYSNVTVTIVVDGMTQYPIECYRMKGDGADQIGVGDTITVTGVLTNYNGKIEFNAGSRMTSWSDTGSGEPDPEPTDPIPPQGDFVVVTDPEMNVAYKIGLVQANLEGQPTLYFNGNDKSDAGQAWYYATTTSLDEAVDVYLEAVEGVDGGFRMYILKNEVKYYLRLNERTDKAGSGTQELTTSVPTEYYVWDATYNTPVHNAPSGAQFFVGTYNTFTTLSASNSKYLTSGNFPIQLLKLNNQEPEEPPVEEDPSYKLTVVTEPEMEVAYKVGLVQANLEGKPTLYFNGKDKSDAGQAWYYATTTSLEEAVDVYLEAVEGVEGGFRMYILRDEVKYYLRLNERTDKAGSGTQEITTTVPAEYYVWDATYNTPVHNAPSGAQFFVGTYNTFTTLSASNAKYLASGNFPIQLMKLEAIVNATAEDAAAQLKTDCPNGYKDDMTLVSSIEVSGTAFTVTWTVEPADNPAVKIEEGKLVLTAQDADVDFVLTATVANGEDTATVTFEGTVEKKPAENTNMYLPKVVTAPVSGVAYKFFIAQNKAEKTLFFNGEKDPSSQYRLNAAEDINLGVDVYLEDVEGVEGGFRLYFMAGDVKTYIRVYEYDNNGQKKGSMEWVTEVPEEYFTFDTTYNTLIYTATNSYYLGTYNTYTTFSVSATSYLSAENVDVSQFPARLATTAPAAYAPVVIETPVAGATYKFLMEQNKTGETLYFNGEKDPSSQYRMNTSSDPEASVDVTLEAVEGVEGGFRLFFMDGETKTYIRVYEYDNNGQKKGSMEWVTEVPEEYFTFDTTFKTLIFTSATENKYYLGTYNNYTTFSVSSISYLNEENAGVSQFPGYLGKMVLKELAPVEVTAPVSGVAYKFFIAQNKTGKSLYFDGQKDPSSQYRLNATEDMFAAVDVFLESVQDVNGGVRLYFMDGDVKTYIRVYEYESNGQMKGSMEWVTEVPEEYFTFDTTYNTLIYTSETENTYYLGTYNTYGTFSVSNISYLNAENVDISQFPARLVTLETN